MPGLAELRASARRIDVTYNELEDGAQLTYRTSEPALTTASTTGSLRKPPTTAATDRATSN
jgi:hypothetical protein